MTNPISNGGATSSGTSIKQDRAIDALLAGKTHEEAAAAAGVTRGTVTRWLKGHPGVQTALNARRAELEAEPADLIRRIDAGALALVAERLENGDADMATQWIRARGRGRVDSAVVAAVFFSRHC